MTHPSSVEQAIKIRYGIRLPSLPSDLRMRKFKIDQFHNGFVLKGVEKAVFGSIIGAETWVWHADRVEWIDVEHKENKDICFEWLVWHAARAVIEEGGRLSLEDGERLALAVKRLEVWL